MKRSLIIIIMCLWVASVGMAQAVDIQPPSNIVAEDLNTESDFTESSLTVKFYDSDTSYNHPYIIIESSDAWNYEDGFMCDKCIMEITDQSGKKTSIPFDEEGEPISIKFIDRLKRH